MATLEKNLIVFEKIKNTVKSCDQILISGMPKRNCLNKNLYMNIFIITNNNPNAHPLVNGMSYSLQKTIWQ